MESCGSAGIKEPYDGILRQRGYSASHILLNFSGFFIYLDLIIMEGRHHDFSVEADNPCSFSICFHAISYSNPTAYKSGTLCC